MKQEPAENNIAPQEDPISFGKYLQQLRQEKGIRLEDISVETKVSMHVLSHIEKETHSELPSPAVVRGFLRLYADCIDADRELLIKLYMEHLEKNTADRAVKGFMGLRFRVFLGLTLFVGVVAFLGLYSFHHVSDTDVAETAGNSAAQEAAVTQPEKTAAAVNMETEAPPPAAEESLVPKKHKLLVEAIDETWIKLIADGKSPVEYTLAAGDHLELEALTDFNLLIGNAGGVKLTLDEKPVHVNGKKGQVLTLQLP